MARSSRGTARQRAAPLAPGDLEARVREWARQEVLAWAKEMEKALHERLQTLAETDVRIIRELHRLRVAGPAGGPEPQ